jgi:hypothetical protein
MRKDLASQREHISLSSGRRVKSLRPLPLSLGRAVAEMRTPNLTAEAAGDHTDLDKEYAISDHNGPD